MVVFLDGPAAGVRLELSRAPVFLRATYDPDRPAGSERWDALDLLDDGPRAGEVLHAYRRVADDGWLHLDGTDKRGRRKGWTIRRATYSYITPQPPEGVMRHTEEWRKWTLEQKALGR